jgi:hypothetical protein
MMLTGVKPTYHACKSGQSNGKSAGKMEEKRKTNEDDY